MENDGKSSQEYLVCEKPCDAVYAPAKQPGGGKVLHELGHTRFSDLRVRQVLAANGIPTILKT